MASKRVHDVVLSSGFLAFGSHAGFLAALEDARLEIDGVCGTSSGALLGALWAAGLTAERALAIATAKSVLSVVRPHLRPWRGVFSLSAMQRELGRHLPSSFSNLERPFAVGVVDALGRHHLLFQGPLIAAVAASCAIPRVFAPVHVGLEQYADGGVADRVALGPWRQLRGVRPTLVHLVARSRGAPGGELPGDVTCVCSPRSGGTFWSYGPVAARFAETRERTRAALDGPSPSSRRSHGVCSSRLRARTGSSATSGKA